MVPIMLINDCLMLILNRDYRSANIGVGKLSCGTNLQFTTLISCNVQRGTQLKPNSAKKSTRYTFSS